MNALDQILDHNREFVKTQSGEAAIASPMPEKKLVVLSCMDTRLIELLPRAMNLQAGDFTHVKNAGAVISHPFGSIMRSLLVAIYELDAREIVVVGHHGCGMTHLRSEAVLEKARQRGVSQETIDTLRHAGMDLEKWLTGFELVEESVRNSVEMIRRHPLLPRGTPVHGLVIHPVTGRLEVVEEGYGRG